MIDIARHYVSRGWPVFPLTPGGKVPVIARDQGGHGCLDATLDLNRVDHWWTQYPEANIGIATGRRSGLLVIDVDPRKTTEWLASVHALALPQTFTVRTWSGGWHIYLTLPPDSQITIGIDLLPGIDWRGQGGYVVAAGSVVEGALYMIARKVPIVAAPAELLERIEAARKARRIEHDATGHMVIPASRRNDTLMRIGCAMRRWGIELNALLEALRAVNADHCEPSLDEEELRQIAASCANYSPSTPSPRTAA